MACKSSEKVKSKCTEQLQPPLRKDKLRRRQWPLIDRRQSLRREERTGMRGTRKLFFRLHRGSCCCKCQCRWKLKLITDISSSCLLLGPLFLVCKLLVKRLTKREKGRTLKTVSTIKRGKGAPGNNFGCRQKSIELKTKERSWGLFFRWLENDDEDVAVDSRPYLSENTQSKQCVHPFSPFFFFW